MYNYNSVYILLLKTVCYLSFWCGVLYPDFITSQARNRSSSWRWRHSRWKDHTRRWRHVTHWWRHERRPLRKTQQDFGYLNIFLNILKSLVTFGAHMHLLAYIFVTASTCRCGGPIGGGKAPGGGILVSNGGLPKGGLGGGGGPLIMLKGGGGGRSNGGGPRNTVVGGGAGLRKHIACCNTILWKKNQ